MARFAREAQVLAGLNHPNIAAIYGLEDRSLVLELVEGPDLSQRIASGPIPLDEALPIACQLAEALEYAHDRGIIHRDLKPANLKVTPEGKLTVLDFGLAKALASEGSAASSSQMSSPTITMRATMAGVILGTAAYMSPEQAKGKPVDRRADIWAFGVLVAEMLTGQRAQQGKLRLNTPLAAILPDFSHPHITGQDVLTTTPITIQQLMTHTSGVAAQRPPELEHITRTFDLTLGRGCRVGCEAAIRFRSWHEVVL
jgi:serine/threonine protein kinase